MRVMLKYTVCALLVGTALGQYGPPQGQPRHRTTTTTEVPDSANEVLPPSPYQPPPGYKPPEENQPQTPYSPSPYQPTPQGSAPQPGQQVQPSVPGQLPAQNPSPSYGQPSPTLPGKPGPQGPIGPQGQVGPQGFPSAPYQPTPQGQATQEVPQNVIDYQQYPPPRPPPATSQQFWWANPQSSPFRPGAKPPALSPGQQNYNPQSPGAGGCSGTPQQQLGPPNRPGFPPQPQQPIHVSGHPSRPSYPPQPQSPAQPTIPEVPQQPAQPSRPSYPTTQPQQPGQPSSPTSSQPQQPLQPSFPSSPQPQQPGQGSFPSSPLPQNGQPSRPSYPPQPQQAGQPNSPLPQPQQPNQPNFPSSPLPQPPSFPSSSLPQPQQPSRPSYPPQPQQAGQPSSPLPQPQQPNQPNFPSSPQPQPPSQPSFPSSSLPQPQQPSRPSYPPQPQQLGQPGFPNTPASQSPSRPSYPPQPQASTPGQPQPLPSSPQTSQPLNNYGPNPQLTPIPQNPRPNPINPNNPFLQSSLQNPIRQESTGPTCYAEAAFCVPSNQCYNGIIADGTSNPTKKGPCSPGEVCCKTKKPITTVPGYPNQPLSRPQYATESPIQKYTGPLNTTPSPECAAALKCVDVSYCTAEGVMSDTPVALTREQAENRVPLTDCQDMNTGIIGKCCRDPNYKDPWPAGMMMPKTDGSGFDDGQYHPPAEEQFDDGLYHPAPEGQYTTEPVNPYTIKLPLGVFNQKVTPFPVAPRPGQTHSQVFPNNPSPGYAPQQPLYPTQQPIYSAKQPQVQPSYQPQQPQYQTQQPTYQPQQPTYQPQQPQTQPQQPQAQPQQSQTQPQQPQTQQQQPQTQPQYQQPQQTQQPTYQPTPYQAETKPQPNLQSQTPQPAPASGSLVPGATCGLRRNVPGRSPDVTGFAEFPWHVLILSKTDNSSLCSGVIIAPNAVMTAANCIGGLKPEFLLVKAGVHVLGQEGERPSQTRTISAVSTHPNYNSGSLVRDEAVLIMEQPLDLDFHIDKVCLPPSGQKEYQPTGRPCYVTGFGRPALKNNVAGTTMHKVPVELIPKDQCESKLKTTHLGKYFILNDGFTCVVPPKESELCKVDVGSPLVCEKSDGNYELAGIYSWDTKCSTELPGVTAGCDTQWVNQVLATPIDQLREEYEKQFPIQHSTLLIDISSKPGFALGYGK